MLVSVRAFAGMALASLFAAHLFIGAPAAFANPAPQLVNRDNVQDADNALFELDQPRSSTTAIVNGTTYLFVGGTVDDGISVFSVGNDGTLTNVDNVDDASDPAFLLDGIRWLTTAEINGTTFLFAAGATEDGVTVFSVGNDGTLTHVDSVDDTEDAALELDLTVYVETAVVNGTTFLFAAGQLDNGVSVFSVSDAGVLTNVDNVDDASDGTFELLEALTLATAAIDGTTYLFVGGHSDEGISVFSVANDGTLTHVDSVDSASSTAPALGNVQALTTGVSGGNTYLFAAGGSGDILSVFYVAADGTLTNVMNVADGPGLALDGAHDVTAITIDGRTYLYAAVINDDRVHVFEVNAAGQLNLIQTVIDDGSLELEGVIALTPTVINNQTYLIASGSRDNGISLFSVANNGTLTSVQNIADDATLLLQSVRNGAIAVVGDQTFFIVASLSDNGVSVFSIAPDGAASSNFAVAGTTATATETRVSSSVIDVTASGGDLAGLDGTVTLSVSGTQDFADLAGNALTDTTPTGTNDNTFVLDRTGPRVSSIERETNADILFPPRWTVRFNENVANLDASDITVDGIPGSMVEIDSGANFIEMQSTVAAFNQLSGTAALAFAAGQDITDTLGNALTDLTPTGTNQNTTIIDRTAPTVVVNIVDSALSDADNTSIVTFEFSEPVSGFTISDATAVGGSMSLLNVVDQDSYSATFTADDNSTTQGSVTVGAGSYDDAVGNGGASGTDTVSVDTVNPALAITGPASPVAGAFTATFTYSESVTGLALGEITVGNGAASNLSGSGTTYTATITPDGDGTVTVDVGAGVAIDAAGNLNTAASQFSVAADTTAPLVASIEFLNPATGITNADSVTWRVTFSEAIANITADDFAVTQTTGTVSVSNITATSVDVTVSGGDMATLNASPTISFAAGQNIADLAGNALTNTSPQGTNDNFYSLDNSPPGVDVFFPLTAPTVAAPTATWSLSFFENVNNLTLDDLQVVASANLSTSNLRITNYAAPSASALVLVDVVSNDGQNGTLSLNLLANTDLVDELGNGNGTNGFAPPFSGNNDNNQFTVDVAAPRITSIVRFSPAAERASYDTVRWRVTFTEAVNNVTADDFTVSGTTGTLSISNQTTTTVDLDLSGGDMASLNGTVTLAVAGGQNITDSAGNALTNIVPTGANEPTFVMDNTPPRLASVVRHSPASQLTNLDSITWRLTYTEDVTGVGTDDFGFTVPFGVDDSAINLAVNPVSASIYDVTLSGGDLATMNGDVTLQISTGVTDLALNMMTDATSLGASELGFTIDNAGPDVFGIYRANPTAEMTNADTLQWAVSVDPQFFGDALIDTSSVDPSDFTLAGPTGATLTTSVVIDAGEPSATIFVTASGGDLATFNGIATLAVAPGNDMRDLAGNSVTTSLANGVQSFSLDNTAPTLVSLVRQSPGNEVTNADSLTWRVTFSETVATVDGSDFSITGATANLTVTPVLPAPGSGPSVSADGGPVLSNTYNVTASGGDLSSLNGVVTLVITGLSAADPTGNPLAGTTPTGTNQPSFSLDNTSPEVTLVDNVTTGGSPTNADALVWALSFSEPVLNLDAGDFVVTNTTATITAVSNPQPTLYTLTASGGDLAGLNGTVTLGFAPGQNIVDAAGNEVGGFGSNFNNGGPNIVVDNTAPRIASIARLSPASEQTDADSLTWRVTFSEFVQNVDAGDFQIAGTTATLSVAPAATAGDVPAGDAPPPSLTNTFDVTASGGDLANLNGAVTLSALTSGGITDNASNAFANAAPTGTNDNSYSVINDADAPTVLSIVRRTPSSELTNADSLTWQVSFSEAVENVDAADFAASGTTATVTGVSPVAATLPPSLAGAGQNGGIVPFAVSSQAFEVTVSGGDLAGLNGPVRLGFAGAQNIADAAGNALTNTTPAGANQGYTLDNIVPTVTIASSAVTPVTGAFPITVTFSEDVTGFDVGDLDLGNGNASNFASSDARTYTATITPGSGATVTVNVAANAASDGAGNGNTAATQFSIGYDNIRTLSVAFTGSGEGNISSVPAGLDCTDDCYADFIVSTEVIVSANAADGSTFLEWTDGPCLGTRNENCIVPMNADRSVAARFQLDEPPAGRIVAATLPAARSGYVGGPVMTAFLSVVSRNETPAQSCYVSAASDAPIALTSQRIDADGNAIGPVNPNFDIEAGGTVSLVLGMTPTAETDGYEFYPIVLCENALLDPVQGVNSVSLTIGSAPVPDILSIGVTPSQDGVIRIASSGGAGAMAASAVNIGAGDGSAGPNEVTLTATVDTGATALPLSLELCRIDAAAQCISPRDASVTAVMAQNDPLFIAVYARDTSGGAGIPFDPANARVFLRFADASGTIRSATSVAVTAPAAADAPELATALPEGRWSVLMRREDGVWPSLTRAALHVASDGLAISDDGVSPRLIRLEGARLAADEPQNGGIRRFMRDGTDGHWTSDGRVLSGGAWIDNAGEFYGIRDARTGAAQTWADFAGAFGDGILISTTGEIRGTVAGCSVYGQSTGSASSLVTLTLSGCASSGGYAGVIDLPANDGDAPVLVIAGERSGWRLAAN